MLPSKRIMNYAKGILSGIAAIFIAEFVFAWPFLADRKRLDWQR